MRIYPVAGRVRRDPRSFVPVPAEGREVPDGDLHWLRALRDGDVTLDAPERAEPEHDHEPEEDR